MSKSILSRVSYDTYTHLTALLAIAANLATLGLLIAWRRDQVPSLAVWGAAGVAAIATVGSLIYSLGYDLIPCDLCWYQRIAMYPLVLILGVAAYRKDLAGARWFGLPVATVGALIASYHYLIQHFPSLEAGTCSFSAPCSAPYVWRYGFLSIPYMALSGFILIIVALVTAREAP